MSKVCEDGGDPALVSQCLDFCQALASLGQTFSFSLKLGSTFTFNLDTREKATTSVEIVKKSKKPSPSTVRRNRKRMEIFIEKKKSLSLEAISNVDNVESIDLPTVHNTESRASGESPEVPLEEIFKNSIPGGLPEGPLACKDDLHECDECGFTAKSSRGLKVHKSTQHKIAQIDGAHDIEENNSRETQTDETCSFCQDFIESKDKHNEGGFCPKNKAAQTQALYQSYGYQNFGGSGFPAWMVHR